MKRNEIGFLGSNVTGQNLDIFLGTLELIFLKVEAPINKFIVTSMQLGCLLKGRENMKIVLRRGLGAPVKKLTCLNLRVKRPF